MSIRMSTRMPTRMPKPVCTRMPTRLPTCMATHMPTRMPAHVSTRMSSHMRDSCRRICRHTCRHTHTHAVAHVVVRGRRQTHDRVGRTRTVPDATRQLHRHRAHGRGVGEALLHTAEWDEQTPKSRAPETALRLICYVLCLCMARLFGTPVGSARTQLPCCIWHSASCRDLNRCVLLSNNVWRAARMQNERRRRPSRACTPLPFHVGVPVTTKATTTAHSLAGVANG